MAQDPVCKMEVAPADARARVVHGSQIYYFCSAHCAKVFEAEPERYIGTVASRESGGCH